MMSKRMNPWVGVWCPWLCSSCRAHRSGEWFAGGRACLCLRLVSGTVPRQVNRLAGGRDMFSTLGYLPHPQHPGPLF